MIYQTPFPYEFYITKASRAYDKVELLRSKFLKLPPFVKLGEGLAFHMNQECGMRDKAGCWKLDFGSNGN
ncbi:hypothetical protein N7516_007370 [Penicillium verrucosum]|uniref:uncharacterized protein n=1 Tax=Penicillium verrucosum TaxID=60171 RepID=UPI0025456A43|nr:uncharacterized protein N7516_007370 [Penicillium verrucosum]KAJ5932881.1 hypothetical protein N7516_007370 [Penicillium verrucosum]